jgi:hypothetical protein
MAKNIEDWVIDQSKTSRGIQVVLRIKRNINEPRLTHINYHATEGHKQFARWRAVAKQVQRAFGFTGNFVCADVKTNKTFYHLLEVQLSYEAAKLESPTTETKRKVSTRKSKGKRRT